MKILKRVFKKKIIIAIIIILVVVFIGYKIFGGNGGPQYVLEPVSYQTVIREVSETGMIKVSEQTDLGFKNSGKMNELYVKVGDEVVAGQELAGLDMTQLYIELSEAQANLDVANADYNKLLAGSSSQEIKVAETDLVNAQVSLENYKQTLEDVKIDAQEDLVQAYQDALDELGDAYLDIYNTFNVVDYIENTYFASSDQEGIIIRDNKSIIQSALNNTKASIDTIGSYSDYNKIDSALLITRTALAQTKNALAEIRAVAESGSYSVTSADKTIIDNQRTYINTGYTEILATQQSISTTRITGESNTNTAKANVSSAEIALQKKKDELDLKKSGPTEETINLYLARIKQAKAQVALTNNRISEATLRSPADGQIIGINKRKGETVQPMDVVIKFLPSGPFQVEVDVYEEDIVNVQVNNYVRVTLPAFPDNVFDGRVISIDPAEKLVDGVVYYEVNISFEINGQNIKPGMTADVIVETNKKDNVLAIPIEAIEKKNGVKMVKMYIGKQVVYKNVEFGLEGEDYIEILSGLEEGEMVITGEKI